MHAGLTTALIQPLEGMRSGKTYTVLTFPAQAGRYIMLLAGLLLLSWMAPDGEEQLSKADPTRQDSGGQFQVNDLRKGLKKILKSGCSKGLSNRTIYVLAWMAAAPHIQRDISDHFWAEPSFSASMVTMLLKYRFGQVWNMK